MTRPRWMDYEPSIVLDDDDHVEDVAVQSKVEAALQCLLDTEVDKHRQSKLRVDELVLLEREACYKLSLETARADAMEDSLKAMTAQLALEHTRRDNLQQALDSTRSKLDGLERESKTRTRDAESSEWHQLDGLNRQLDALQKKLKVAADGEAFWKDRARTAELAVENATRNNNKTTRHDEGVVKLQDAPCIACIAQREENETLGTQLRQSQANLESISSAKHTADSKNLQLSNALAALEKTLASRTAELQDELQDARQDLAIFTVQSEEQVNELERRLHEYEQATTANVADIAGTRRRLEEQLVVNDSLLTQLAEAERRMDDAESRLVEVFKDKSREVPSSVAASPNSSQILLDTPDASLERGDKEVLSNRLALCQEELRIAQSDKTALENDCEALSLQVTHLTSELQVRDERISGLSDDREVNDNASIATYQHLQAECKTLTEALKDREEDIFSTRAELESLKRDALSLRDQLQSQSAQSSSPRQHRRPSSIPFCPSPLRQASFPPPSYSSTVGAKLSSLSMRDNQEQAVVLVARLRQERDDAIDQLEYHVAESAVANKALQEDLAVLKNEKSELDQLLQNFKTVVKKKEDLLAAADADVQRLLVAEKDLSSTVLALQIKLQEGDTAHQGTLQQLQDLENEIGSLDSERDRQKLELARTCEDRRVAQGTVTLLRASHDALQAQILDSELHWHTAANNMKQKTDMYHAERTGLEIEISAKQQEFKAVEEKLADTAMQLEGAQNLALQLETQLKEQAVRSELCEAETQKVVIRLESELADIMAQRTRDTGEHVRAQQKLQDSLDQAAVSYRHAHDTIGRLQLQLADQAVLIEESAAETEASAASADGVTKLVIALAISARDATRLRATMRSLLAAAVIKTGRLSDEISRRIGMQQANESLSAEAAEQQLTLDSVTARLTQLVDHVHSSDEATAVLRAQYEEALQRNGQLEAKLSQMDHQDSAGLLIDLASRNREIEQLRHKYAIAQQDLEVSQVDLRKALAEIDALRNELHLQQEEGRDLVADFNRLSGEMEQLEQQDQTRSMHSETQERKLAEAVEHNKELALQRDELVVSLSDLESRLKDLAADLENRQAEMEETDDRYLESLKKIKKQDIQLDKLRVRVEALSRANTLLSQAVPPSVLPDVMAPAPSSATKRGLPDDFVAKDLGPAAIITTNSRSLTIASEVEVKAHEFAVKSDASGARVVDTQMMVHSVVAVEIPEQPPQALVTAFDSAEKPRRLSSRPISRAPTAPLGAARPRQPLSALSTQPRSTATQKEVQKSEKAAVEPLKAVKLPPTITEQPTKASSQPLRPIAPLGSRPAYKPTAALGSKGLSSRSSIAAQQQQRSTDTKALLASLQVLKRPAAQLDQQ